jgi:hypothetical protein
MRANRAGRVAEDVLAAVMTGAGLRFDRQVTIGCSIFGTALRADFVIHNLPEFPRGLAVESKWQDIGGSVDEKFPYLLINIRERYPIPTLVVVHGGGCRPGAVEWLRSGCDSKLIGVFGLEEFLSWAQRTTKV